ncbi:glycosyltransferase [Limibacter armeniacum]|uniref:glycosyltransferase family 2 protein n=1 Tax=Limibacter armeniacum TaxID=466084 RepID=UPI002FE53F0E
MLNDPLISIIIPSYNRADLISETLNSVLLQTYIHWECIVVDDGSIDKTLDVVQKFVDSDDRIKLVSRKRGPKGAATCRNIGVDLSCGDFLIFLDSDDLIAPYCLEKRLYKILNTSLDFVVFPMVFFCEKILDDTQLFSNPSMRGDLSQFLSYSFPWSITSPLWRKSSFKKLKGFDENSIGGGQDWELHVRALIMSMSYLVCNDELPDCFYRKHEGVRISNQVSKAKIESRKELYTRIGKLLLDKVTLDREQKESFVGVFLQLVCEPFLTIDYRLSILSWKDFTDKLSISKRVKFTGLIYLKILHLLNSNQNRYLRRGFFYGTSVLPDFSRKSYLSSDKKLEVLKFINVEEDCSSII